MRMAFPQGTGLWVYGPGGASHRHGRSPSMKVQAPRRIAPASSDRSGEGRRNGSFRCCVTTRALMTSHQDSYPLPRTRRPPWTLWWVPSGFSTLDMKSWVSTGHDGDDRTSRKLPSPKPGAWWQFKVMHCLLAFLNASATYSSLMERVLEGLHGRNITNLP
ncbi:hypothetical protein GWK47_047425 [Chionoecetes opilio]|uniref:Uncharacterized protein n=1 Tax=Chionoecetes opilio TaxID=41210 RepID=A0A8J4Y4N8_CHIOP|nr:hypothetical protein GWK47_047425 [Chionoecetes opilio]